MSDTPTPPDDQSPAENPIPAEVLPPSSTRQAIVERPIARELHESYLTYAMSTITDRALPDVRDGLKPSQRRILVAMNDLNLSPGRKHRKCAKIAGDTSGNYHPHGESVIYPTLVNMAQNWKMRCLHVDKQGNFGSIDGDPPAAMRYTEARLAPAAMDMLADLKLDTVDFKANYDETRQEPTVLPAKFPNLLVNGSSGIAVGMASSMPPHNVGEICDAIMAQLEDPEIELADLMEMVPGPDFPTGGIIQGRRGILDAYSTGRGRVQLRGRVHQETMKGREVIIIDEIPYHLVQRNLIEKLVEAAKAGRIPDISDIKNFSGKSHRTRIVVYLKRGADPDVVEKQLYQYTPLQSTISIINIALDRGRPRTMGLKQLIKAFIDHRRIVIRRRTEHLLREARKQAHRLEGLIFAVCDIDEVIALIRASRTREEAIQKLIERAFQIPRTHPYATTVPERLLERCELAAATEVGGVQLSRVQAEAIGALRLIQLVGLEIERLVKDYADLLAEIQGYEAILADDARVRAIIREDCLEIKDRHATARLTTIEDAESEDLEIGDLIAEHECVVTVSHAGYIKRMPVDTYREQGRGGRGIKGSQSKEGDFISQLFVSSSHDDLLCFTNTGRVFRKKVFQIPEMSRTSQGRAIVNLLDLKGEERVVAFLTISDFEVSEDYLFFATSSGRVKRSSLKDFRNVNRSGIIAVNLNEGDRLIDVVYTTGDNHVLLATADGMAIRFDENDARVMGRNAAGVKGIDLAKSDQIVGLVRVTQGSDLLTVTEHGYGKRTPIDEYLVQSEAGNRPQSRGGKGRLDIRTTDRNGRVVAVLAVEEEDGLMLVTERGLIVRISAESVRQTGRNTQGVRVINLKGEDRLMSIARVADSGDEPEPVGEGGPAGGTPPADPADTTDAPPSPDAAGGGATTNGEKV